MIIGQKTKIVFEFYFNHSTTVNFSSFESWRIQIKPQLRVTTEEKRERMNQKVSAKDVTSSLHKAKITLFFVPWRIFFSMKLH